MKTYLRHSVGNVIDIKELIALEYLDFEGKYRDYVESHDFWELCYVSEGGITLFLEDVPMELAGHQLILIPPNRKHSFLSQQGNANKAFVVCFDSFSQALSPISGSIFPHDAVQKMCMQTIIAEWSSTYRVDEQGLLQILPSPRFGGQQALTLQLQYLLIHLVRKMSLEKGSDLVFFREETFYADLVNVVLRFLRKNIHRKLTLDDICGRFNYSKSFLCKTFKEQTGQTLMGCFNDLKVAEAKRLLVQTDQSVTAIAESLGFREVKYFDTIFKKSTGMTPVTYRIKEANYENRRK